MNNFMTTNIDHYIVTNLGTNLKTKLTTKIVSKNYNWFLN